MYVFNDSLKKTRPRQIKLQLVLLDDDIKLLNAIATVGNEFVLIINKPLL